VFGLKEGESKYFGEFKAGQYSGKARYYFQGSVHIGEYLENAMNGAGLLITQNGD